MSKLIVTLIITVSLSALSLPAFALEEMDKRPDFAIGTMLGSLMLVLACIFLFAFVMKKSNLMRYGGNKNPIKVIATQALTNKSRIQIVEVYGKQYLLGVSDQSINLLDQLESPSQATESEIEAQTPPSFATAFASVLSKAGKKNNE